MLALEVAGSPAYLEPDAVVVHPDGRWTVVEIKSFPMIDGSADAAKVGAAARQAAVYVLALERIAARDRRRRGRRTGCCWSARRTSPTCRPRPSSTSASSCAVTRRQLARLTRIEDIAAALPEGTTFDLERAGRGADGRGRVGRARLRPRVPGRLRAGLPLPGPGPRRPARWRRWAGACGASWAG